MGIEKADQQLIVAKATGGPPGRKPITVDDLNKQSKAARPLKFKPSLLVIDKFIVDSYNASDEICEFKFTLPLNESDSYPMKLQLRDVLSKTGYHPLTNSVFMGAEQKIVFGDPEENNFTFNLTVDAKVLARERPLHYWSYKSDSDLSFSVWAGEYFIDTFYGNYAGNYYKDYPFSHYVEAGLKPLGSLLEWHKKGIRSFLKTLSAAYVYNNFSYETGGRTIDKGTHGIKIRAEGKIVDNLKLEPSFSIPLTPESSWKGGADVEWTTGKWNIAVNAGYSFDYTPGYYKSDGSWEKSYGIDQFSLGIRKHFNF